MNFFGMTLAAALRPFGTLGLALALASCGYSLQTSDSSALDKEGIHRIYVRPMVNNTYKSGVENLVYNTLLRALSGNRRIQLVRSLEEADGIFSGTVNEARFYSSAAVTGDLLKPVGTGGQFANLAVASEYTSTVHCSFALTRRLTPPGKNPTVWSATFSRSKPFPASNQLGSLGTTSALINDSEFDRSLSDMVQSMMGDVRESMLARF